MKKKKNPHYQYTLKGSSTRHDMTPEIIKERKAEVAKHKGKVKAGILASLALKAKIAK